MASVSPLIVRNDRCCGISQRSQGLLMEQPLQPTVQRRNSYPLDGLNFYQESLDPATSPSSSQVADSEPTPTLVSRLQQVHGLTKKKVYGAKPVRQPFFRERENLRISPGPLTMPSLSGHKIPSPTGGGRVPSQARADRTNRLSQASPTDIYSRRTSMRQLRASRLSTPEAESLIAGQGHANDISPGSSYVSSDYSSPLTPAAPEDNYTSHNLVDHSPTAIHTAPVFSYHYNGVPDAPWGTHPHYPGGYSAQSQSYFPPTPQQLFASEGVQPHQQAQVAQLSSQRADSFSAYVTSAPTSSWQAPMTMPGRPNPSANMGSAEVVPAPPAPATASRTAKKAVAQEDEDEERFTFGKEFVAATAVLFDTEVLPAYPDFPGSSSGLVSDLPDASLDSIPLGQAGGLFASRPRHRASVPSFHSNGTPTSSIVPSSVAAVAGVHGQQQSHTRGHLHYHSMSSSHTLPSPALSSHSQTYYDQGPPNGPTKTAPRYPPAYLAGASSLTGWPG